MPFIKILFKSSGSLINYISQPSRNKIKVKDIDK